MMDCPVPELGYGVFSRRLVDRLRGERYPLSGSIELTFHCNLRCQHCYVACGNNPDRIQNELSAEEWYGALDEIADAGTLWLLLSGGEPLMRPDFLDLYKYVKRKGFIITLFTNGTTLTPKIADVLAEWRPFAVEITLYGRTRETYERVTGVSGSYARCIRGIELLLERDAPLRLKTMLLTLNQHELWDIKAYAESLDVPFRFDPLVNGGIDRSDSPKRLRLEPEEVVAYDMADEQRWLGWCDFYERYRALRPDHRYIYTCGAGITTFHVDPYCHLSTCMMVRSDQYDLSHGTFSEGWQHLGEVRKQPAPEDYVCRSCELRSFCEQCPGWCETDLQGAFRPVDYLCEVTHRRIANIQSSNNLEEETEDGCSSKVVNGETTTLSETEY